jgi:hypothetical protein
LENFKLTAQAANGWFISLIHDSHISSKASMTSVLYLKYIPSKISSMLVLQDVAGLNEAKSDHEKEIFFQGYYF